MGLEAAARWLQALCCVLHEEPMAALIPVLLAQVVQEGDGVPVCGGVQEP